MSAAVSSGTEISRLFLPARMQLNLHSSTRDDVLFELINCVPAMARNLELKRQLHRALVERENLCCTAVGRGIAIPHTRGQIAGAAPGPIVVFGRHAQGLLYCENDPRPIFLFFLLLAPDIYQHLQTLARLTRLLRDEPLREELLRVSSPEEVIQAI